MPRFDEVEQNVEARLARASSRRRATEMVEYEREWQLRNVILHRRDDIQTSIDLHVPIQSADLGSGLNFTATVVVGAGNLVSRPQLEGQAS